MYYDGHPLELLYDYAFICYGLCIHSQLVTERDLMSADLPIRWNTEKGWIVENGKRVDTFRLETFQAFEKRLISLVVETVGETTLYQTGNEIGRVISKYVQEAIKAESDFGNSVRQLSAGGWGRFGAFEKLTRDGKIVYTVQAIGTPSSHECTPPKSIFHTLGGMVSGYLEAYLGKKAQSHAEQS